MSGRNILARAIYDNVSESKDELDFHRGDVITVVEQNTAGLEGWWLCSFQGKQGIAPGNRLQLLPVPTLLSNKPVQTGDDTYDVPPSHMWAKAPAEAEEPEEEYDVPRSQPPINYNNNNMGALDSPTEIYDIPRASNRPPVPEDEVYDIPPMAISLKWKNSDQDVYNVPSSFSAIPDPMAVYDVPPLVSRGPQSSQQPEEVYDVPPRRTDQLLVSDMINVQEVEEVYDVPPSRLEDRSLAFRHESTGSDVVYDIPQSNRTKSGRVVSSGLNSLRRMRREITEISQKPPPSPIPEPSSEEYIYDVPPQVTKDNNSNSLPATNADDVVNNLLRGLSVTNAPNDVNLKKINRVSTASKDSFSSYIDDNPLQYEELKVSLNDAVEQLILLKQNLEDAVSSLLLLIKEDWRKKQNLSEKIHNVQKSFLEILLAVNHFVMFARGAVANAYTGGEETRAPKPVQHGLRKFLIPIEEDLEMLKRALNNLEACQWDINKLAVDGNNEDGIILDDVDSFVMTSRAVSDDAKQMATFIHTHAQYIFKKSLERSGKESIRSKSPDKNARPVQEIQALQARPLPAIPPNRDSTIPSTSYSYVADPEGLMEDYDYVALQDKDEMDQNQAQSPLKPISGLNKRKTQLGALEREILQSKNEIFVINPVEKKELKKHHFDVPDLMQSLSEVIDRFINAVDNGQPPHTFVALSKQVILCAYKLIFVGDCIYQNISDTAAKTAIKDHCELMCASLKKSVGSVKLAALQWPTVSAIQDAVDKMFEIAICAHQFSLTLKSILP